jgi:hypothetical protein
MQPLEELAKGTQGKTISQCQIALAKSQTGERAWRQRVAEFTSFAPDLHFRNEYNEIAHVPERFQGDLKRLIESDSFRTAPEERWYLIDELVELWRKRFLEYVDRVPIEWEPEVFAANTPFSSYLRIKEALVSVKRRLHYFDRYLKPDFFDLFLAGVETTIEIRLVTTQGKGDARQGYGVAAVGAVSKIAAREFKDYQLIEVSPADIHDRNLRVDDQIFNLGTGVDKAGMALTNFGPSDSTPHAHAQFDSIIAGGTVVS